MDKVELAGSLVAKCWSTFVDESEKILKMVKDNADFLASTTLEMLNNLFTEKRSNRKFYHEEHGRICQELQRLQDNVARLRVDYERCVDNYNSCKAKYDDQKQKGAKRIEEFKDRYLKVYREYGYFYICLMFWLNVSIFQACKKMHNVHNEYILLLCEAAEFERDMRTILLPGLLEHQQAIHEDSTDRWKMILQDIYRFVILVLLKIY